MIPNSFYVVIFVVMTICAVASLFLPKSRRRSRSSSKRQRRTSAKPNDRKRSVVPPPSPEARGMIGERDIANVFETLAQNGFVGSAVRNVYIPKEDGTFSEIDVVYVCSKGLFVVESKNYSGWIFGSEDEQNWTQRFVTGTTESFYNPIKQNEGHVRYLKKYLKVPLRITPIVVFSNNCELKQINLKSSPKPTVIQLRELYNFVANQWRFAPDVLSGEQIIMVASMLENLANVSDDVKKAHVARVESVRTFPHGSRR